MEKPVEELQMDGGAQQPLPIKPPVQPATNPAPAPAVINNSATITPQAPKAHMVSTREMVTPFFDPVVWDQMKGMAATFAQSGAFPPTDNAAKIMVKLQAGQEMGMTPIESVKSFYFVNGQINIFAAAITRRLRVHGWTISYADDTNKCTATVSKGSETYEDTLTFKDAEDSGWTKGTSGALKPGWKPGANRRLKLRYGVLSMIIKTYIPEVLGSAADIAEVAMEAAPVYEAYATQLPEIKDGDEKPTEAQLSTIKSMGGDEKEVKTKQQAAQMIIDLSKKRRPAKKKDEVAQE